MICSLFPHFCPSKPTCVVQRLSFSTSFDLAKSTSFPSAVQTTPFFLFNMKAIANLLLITIVVLLVTRVVSVKVFSKYAFVMNQDVDKKSILDDCCCEVDNVLTANHQDLNPLLNEIVVTTCTIPFSCCRANVFSTILNWTCLVNVHSGLLNSYVVNQYVCKVYFSGVGGCAICECNEDEVLFF